jgi:hypothetical protein
VEVADGPQAAREQHRYRKGLAKVQEQETEDKRQDQLELFKDRNNGNRL